MKSQSILVIAFCMFDVLLSALPPQATSLAESTKVKSPTVEQVVHHKSPKSPLKLTGVAPESIPQKPLAKQKMGAFYPLSAKVAVAASLPLQQAGTGSSQMSIDVSPPRRWFLSLEVLDGPIKYVVGNLIPPLIQPSKLQVLSECVTVNTND